MPHQIPARPDGWQPRSSAVDTIVGHYRAAVAAEGKPDGSGELAALLLLAVVVGGGLWIYTGSVVLATVVPLVLAGGGALVVLGSQRPTSLPADVDVFASRGGAGTLPAGYLVSPGVWDLGMRQRTASVAGTHLQAAAQLCREYPGSVNGLLEFVARIDAVTDSRGAEGQPRVEQLVRAGAAALAGDGPAPARPARARPVSPGPQPPIFHQQSRMPGTTTQMHVSVGRR
ncbi:hypothetical protein EV385_5552 [Krasilnikovia cinnamomea]|uniref:Uncharacterized protein n=1 Tax=Krasilnikovia cinnamomea TaxID=349313 RepID=A0A4Q7ZS29_9ACTN|nr:hypothetical protein [Krasilnikovia cinnamomea]RZU53621.1 hypothetical protein EV385_5552 [Krasilnikovia cinnamomea]